MQPDQDDDLSPGEILDDLRRRCLAYVAEHYEPVGADEEIADEDYIGTNHDPEHVWDEALQSVLGPDEWWDRWARTPDVTKLSEEEVDRYATVALAWIAVAAVGKKAVRELEHQERLFGKAAENPEVFSPEWTALFASGFDEQTPDGQRLDLIVANYLTNVRGGLMDATGMFHYLEEEAE